MSQGNPFRAESYFCATYLPLAWMGFDPWPCWVPFWGAFLETVTPSSMPAKPRDRRAGIAGTSAST